MRQTHVLVRLDSNNGRAEFVEELELSRNNSYVLLMELNENSFRVLDDDTRQHPLEEVARLTNPEELDTIFGLVELMKAEEGSGD